MGGFLPSLWLYDLSDFYFNNEHLFTNFFILEKKNVGLVIA